MSVLSNDIKDAQMELSLCESRLMRMKKSVRILARKRPTLKKDLLSASRALSKAYDDLCTVDEKLSNLDDLVNPKPKSAAQEQRELEQIAYQDYLNMRNKLLGQEEEEEARLSFSSSSSSSEEEEEVPKKKKKEPIVEKRKRKN
jgi:hypothetical protein